MDDIRCPSCSGFDIIKGDLSASYGLMFIPEGQAGKLVKKSSGLRACACRDCGAVFGFELTDKPNKLTK